MSKNVFMDAIKYLKHVLNVLFANQKPRVSNNEWSFETNKKPLNILTFWKNIYNVAAFIAFFTGGAIMANAIVLSFVGQIFFL